jgi:hypothetical protein
VVLVNLREQIAAALHDHDHMHTWGSDYCDDACSIASFRRADVVLAVMPPMEAIARTIYEQDMADGAVRPSPWESASEETRAPYEHTAWALLALLNGPES